MAIAITIGMMALSHKEPASSVLLIASIIWVMVDAKRVRFWRYRTGISGRPSTVLIILLILGWPLVFPWYLGMRLKIWAGTARLREEYQDWRMSDGGVGPNGLVQPWRGRRLPEHGDSA